MPIKDGRLGELCVDVNNGSALLVVLRFSEVVCPLYTFFALLIFYIDWTRPPYQYIPSMMNGHWTMVRPTYGCRMIVMDRVNGTSVEEALHLLHSEDIIFADLRTNNILYVASEHRVVLIDFDWPGKNRESRYPVMLHSDEVSAEWLCYLLCGPWLMATGPVEGFLH